MMEVLVHGLLYKVRRTPFRSMLIILQITISSFVMTLAACAYLDVIQRQRISQSDRFDLLAGYVDDDGVGVNYPFFDESSAQQLKEYVSGVKDVAFFSLETTLTIQTNGRLYELLRGAYVDTDYFRLNQVNLLEGSLFTDKDMNDQSSVILISDRVAKILFGMESPIGMTLQIVPDDIFIMYDTSGNRLGGPLPEDFNIIGVFAEKGKGLDSQFQPYFYLPFWKRSQQLGGSFMLNILAEPGRGQEVREQVINASRQLFRKKYPEFNMQENKDFYIQNLGGDGIGSKADTDSTTLMIILFGITCVVVSGIGIFSTMFIDSLESERSVGVKRALGASNLEIIVDVITTSTILTTLGALCGTSLAFFVIPGLVDQVGNTVFANINLRWQPLGAITVIVLTAFLGCILSIFPAIRLSRMSIVHALTKS